MNKLLNIAAKVSFSVSLFMASGLGDAIKRFICWCFDRDCYPGKHNIPGWENISDFTNLFM